MQNISQECNPREALGIPPSFCGAGVEPRASCMLVKHLATTVLALSFEVLDWSPT
jgi:hypothetical protein